MNNYTGNPKREEANQNGYGGMSYYTSDTCGYNNGRWIGNGCRNDYESSDVKYVIDSWAKFKVPSGLVAAKLINLDELSELGEFTQSKGVSNLYQVIELKYDWLYSTDYWYWTMTPYQDSNDYVWGVEHDGLTNYHYVDPTYSYTPYSDWGFGVVRPVIVLHKTALGDKDESVIDDNNEESIIDDIINKISEDDKNTFINNVNNSNKNMTSIKVKVENTYLSQSLLVLLLGFVISCISVTIYYIIRKRKKE